MSSMEGLPTKTVDPPVGLTMVSVGPTMSVGPLTVKASVRVTLWAPVVTLRVRKPAVAAASIASVAVRLVGLATVTALTVMPVPRLTWLWPWAKLVFTPVMVTTNPV